MTKVVLRTFGQITALSKGNQADIEFSGNTIKDLLQAIEGQFGPGLRSILYPDGENLSSMIYVLVNGKNIQQLDGIRTDVHDGDIVSVLPVTAGG